MHTLMYQSVLHMYDVRMYTSSRHRKSKSKLQYEGDKNVIAKFSKQKTNKKHKTVLYRKPSQTLATKTIAVCLIILSDLL